jgi:hypothetical protein
MAHVPQQSHLALSLRSLLGAALAALALGGPTGETRAQGGKKVEPQKLTKAKWEHKKAGQVA